MQYQPIAKSREKYIKNTVFTEWVYDKDRALFEKIRG